MRAARAEVGQADDRGRVAVHPRLGHMQRLGPGRDLGGEPIGKGQAQDPRCNRLSHAADGQRGGQVQERVVGLIKFANDARADIGAPVEELLLDLVFDDLAPFLDNQNLFQPLRKMPDAFWFQRPGHAHFVKTQADGGLFGGTDAQFGQGLPHILVSLARGDNAKAGVLVGNGDLINMVGTGKGDGGVALVFLQPFILHQG